MSRFAAYRPAAEFGRKHRQIVDSEEADVHCLDMLP